MEVICKYCGKSFRTSHSASVYCSKDCASRDYKIRMRGENNPHYSGAGGKVCLNCGKEYHSYNKDRKYCSRTCAKIANQYILDEYNQKIRKTKHCPKCGVLLTNNSRVYCDEHNPNIRKTGNCKVCGNIIDADRVYCSRKCRWLDYKRAPEPESVCTICGTTVYKPYRKYCDSCWSAVCMTKRGIPRRVDQNQAEIVDALRSVGCSVIDTSMLGGGSPDLMVGRFEQTFLIEVKNPKSKGRLNKLQQKWHDEWRGHVAIAYTIEDALRIVGAIK